MLKSPLLISGLALAAAIALAQPANAETREFDFEGFSSLKAKQSINVIYTASETFSVTADVEDDDFDELIVAMRGDALVLERPKKRTLWFGNNRNRPDITVYVSAPTLSAVQVSSGAQFEGDNLTANSLNLSASSSADIEIATVSTGNLKSSASSSGTIELAGTCTAFDGGASSSGQISGDGLVCQSADIDASSSGKVTLGIDGGSVDVNLSSSGRAELSGNCDLLEASASSGADVRARSLTCAHLDARVSSGASIDIGINETVQANASSGGDIDIYGAPTDVDERTSSGGDVDIHAAL